jgi:hypothetical protein
MEQALGEMIAEGEINRHLKKSAKYIKNEICSRTYFRNIWRSDKIQHSFRWIGCMAGMAIPC